MAARLTRKSPRSWRLYAPRINRVRVAMGSILRLFSFAFFVPLVAALVYDAPKAYGSLLIPQGVLVYLCCFGVTYLFARLLRGRNVKQELQTAEAYLTVGIGWIMICLFAMIPFMLQGVLTNPIDAWFETMSGLTTTGASVIAADLDTVPKSLMVWRALLQFIGGMGIIVLSVALLGRFTQGGSQLLQAEAPGPSVQRIAPRIAQTARLLWMVYASIAAVLFCILLVVLWSHGYGFKQSVYEALILTFTTVSTGGFGAHSASIAYYHDSILETVLIVFMLISGMNYTLHYYALRGKLSILRDPEWRFYMGSFVVVGLALTGVLVRAGQAVGQSFRGALFTVASLITSTGFATADYDVWPNSTKVLLLFLMGIGATAGSTGGGVKHIRIMLVVRAIAWQLRKKLHPSTVNPVKLGGRTVPQDSFFTVGAFLFAFLTAWGLGALLLLWFDPAFNSILDAGGASISALSNMGPGFGVVGPTQNYAGLTGFAKLLLAGEMWFGRLEIFAALLVMMPSSWRV